MRINVVGAHKRNFPFGTEIAFSKGLRQLGHDVTDVDTSYPDAFWDMQADATLVFKWIDRHWDRLEHCTGVKIVYQPDDYRFPHINQMMATMRKYCDFALTYDAPAAEMIANDHGYLLTQEMLLTADPALYYPLEIEKDIDMCFIGSLSYGENHRSRVHMLNVLSSAGFNVATASELFDIRKINEIYNRSKIVLNHATDVGQEFGYGYGYQCRHFEAGMAGCCLLSNQEIVSETSPRVRGFVRFSSEKELLDQARMLLENDALRRQYSENLYYDICTAHMPRHRAAEVLAFIDKCRKVSADG